MGNGKRARKNRVTDRWRPYPYDLQGEGAMWAEIKTEEGGEKDGLPKHGLKMRGSSLVRGVEVFGREGGGKRRRDLPSLQIYGQGVGYPIITRPLHWVQNRLGGTSEVPLHLI